MVDRVMMVMKVDEDDFHRFDVSYAQTARLCK